MSLYGARECSDEAFAAEVGNTSATYTQEGRCTRFWRRLMTCVRESQEMDVMYDCRSRLIDMRECVVRHKQSTWAMRETLATMRNENEFRKWLRMYDERMGHPPLLEAVRKVREKVEDEGGIDILNPTVFKDPDLYIPRKEYDWRTADQTI